MTTHEDTLEPTPEPPRLGAYVAVLLELVMLGVFAYNRSILGAVVWVVYFRFSATRALVYDLWKGD